MARPRAEFGKRPSSAGQRTDAIGPGPESGESPEVLSVAELTESIKGALEGAFPDVWVAGEVSNLSRPQSGHVYLTLKDAEAQIRAVVWRNTARGLKFELADGLEVVCHGGLDVYLPRGSYQLVIDRIQPLGLGALELALRQLQARLAAEGLFDPARKRPLPQFPRRIGVVTSPTGAAIHDFLEVLRRRSSGVDVLVVPTRVQGEGAAEEIAAAITLAGRLAGELDCLVVTRGGGSLEDLWSFNEEPVVRAIAASPLPVISAVGHEIDVTLADLVADVRALTPSEAAELVAPAADALRQGLVQQQRRLAAALRGRAQTARSRWEALAARRVFRQPLEAIHRRQQGLDELSQRAQRAIRQRLRLAEGQSSHLAARLEALSPLGVLARGYSLTQPIDGGGPIRQAGQLAIGQQIATRFAQGSAVSRVESIEPHGPPTGAIRNET